MIRKIKNIVWKILNIFHLGGPLQLILKSELKENGWFNSFNKKMSVDRNGQPLPWNTYSYIKFIEPRLKNDFDVFEYGSGNSTIWYAKRIGTIKSVENDKDWYNLISKTLPANAELIYRELSYGGDYCKEINKADKKYHIVIIDGRDRNNCLLNAENNLTEDGVIIFDNSESEEYQESVSEFQKKEFKRIDFIGMLPVVAHGSCTTIFYRKNNCLGI